MLAETRLLEHIWPTYLELFGQSGGLGRPDAPGGPTDAPGPHLWRFLDALDAFTRETGQIASNGVLQALLFAPLVGEDMMTGSRQGLGERIEELTRPAGIALGVAKRDRELARQIIMAHRHMVQPAHHRRRASIAQREYFHDALIFLGLSVDARGGDGSELEHWRTLATRTPTEAVPLPEGRRRRRGGRRRRGASGRRGDPHRGSSARAGDA
jgi:poly(A) polymerase